jgi:uncharacterized protein YndB with AHSA1/START domain
MENTTRSGAEDREPLVSRLLDVPREIVFRAWIDADRLARWWGPSGLEVPRESVTIEPRVGGRYDLSMVQVDDGARFRVRNRILELVEPELLVLESDPMPEFGAPEPIVTRIEFDDDQGKTRLKLSRPYSSERRASAQAGWSSSFDKLEAMLKADP